MTAAPPTEVRNFDERWRLSRAGIVNVWRYLDNEFDLADGRMILRGTNGSGKSRALEMLLPFLLDADERRMDATGAGQVRLDELMRVGADGQTNRTGHLWMELRRPRGEFLTVGALIRHSQSANRVQVWYYMTRLRIGHDIQLISERREPLTRDALAALIGAEQITDSPQEHRDRVRAHIFGLYGDSGTDRYLGLMQLLHTLRAPDVGNRIDEGGLPQILSDSMPPLSELAILRAGEQLDALTMARLAHRQQESDAQKALVFLAVYRRYAAAVLIESAEQTLTGVAGLAAAEAAAARQQEEHQRLERMLSGLLVDESRINGELQELENALRGVTNRDVFSRADELLHRDRAVDALAEAVDRGLARAGENRHELEAAATLAEAEQVELDALQRRVAGALSTARAALQRIGLSAALDDETGRADFTTDFTTDFTPDRDRPDESPNVAYSLMRVNRNADPIRYARPSLPALTPSATGAPEAFGGAVSATSLVGAAAAAETVAARRRDVARRRLRDARRVERGEDEVRALEADAVYAVEAATADSDRLLLAQTRRDDLAVDLALRWRTWVEAPSTKELLGDVEWASSPAIKVLLLDVETLTGEAATDLDELDRAADIAAAPARQQLSDERARLRVEAGERATRRQNLLEQPEPSTTPERPLWSLVEFLADVEPADQSLIEGALAAAGILDSRLYPDAQAEDQPQPLADQSTVLDVRAALQAPAAPARHSQELRALTAVLRPTRAAKPFANQVISILSRIGLDEDKATTSVARDGRWRNGLLRAQAGPARRRRIASADDATAVRDRGQDQELLGLALAQNAGEDAEEELQSRWQRLEAHLATAPRSADLFAARQLAGQAELEAQASRSEVERSSELARERRERWASEATLHRDTCAHYGIAHESWGIEQLVVDAGDAVSAARLLQVQAEVLRSTRGRYERQVATAHERAAAYDESTQSAERLWREWSDLAAEVAAIRESVDLPGDRATIEVQRSMRAHGMARQQLRDVAEKLAARRPELGASQARYEAALEQVERQRDEMAATALWFSRRLALPGLAAATGSDFAAVDFPRDPYSVRQAAERVISRLRPSGEASNTAAENDVLTALQTFSREASTALQVRYHLSDGVHLVEISGADSSIGAYTAEDRTVTAAAQALTRAAEQGRVELAEREREVFTGFILGGLAHELRKRVAQAGQLVVAMNESLRNIRTSNGIGVQLRWSMVEDQPALSQILELVAIPDAEREPAQNRELTELVRQRVEEFHAADPSGGYARHLSAALDYRRWYDVGVTILGPEPDQRRRLSRRAKLSQGETRFVSYVTLFAAADGYLTSLGDNDAALRLILLDDAFAKVDDGTVAELMGLLVRLDLDFVLTGHALWGCFEQVPSLDIYEVRRDDGSSAITTHVHWNGHVRQLISGT